MFCKNCGKEVNEKAIACLNCGFEPDTENNFCQECGAETKDKQIICIKCGTPLKQNKQPAKLDHPRLNSGNKFRHNGKIETGAIFASSFMLICLILPWNGVDFIFSHNILYPFFLLISSIGGLVSLLYKLRNSIIFGVLYLLVVSIFIFSNLWILRDIVLGRVGPLIAIISPVIYIYFTIKELKK